MKLSFSPRSRIPPRVSKQVSQKINNRIFIEILVRSERFEISIQSERKRRERKRNELASLEIEESIVGLVCNGAACAGVKRQIGTYNGELWGVRERVKRIFHARWLKACTTTLLFTRAVLPLSFGEKKRKRKIFFEKQKCSSLVFPKLGGKIEISFSYFSPSILFENRGNVNILSPEEFIVSTFDYRGGGIKIRMKNTRRRRYLVLSFSFESLRKKETSRQNVITISSFQLNRCKRLARFIKEYIVFFTTFLVYSICLVWGYG